MKLFFDGGWRPEAGMETAVVLRGQAVVRRDLGPGSSMAAEWLALLHAVELARGEGEVVLLGDAAAVIAQANGDVPARGQNAAYLAAFRAAVGDRPPLVRYIKRTQNLAGIALARGRA